MSFGQRLDALKTCAGLPVCQKLQRIKSGGFYLKSLARLVLRRTKTHVRDWWLWPKILPVCVRMRVLRYHYGP
jgi:hypothetical protein